MKTMRVLSSVHHELPSVGYIAREERYTDDWVLNKTTLINACQPY